MNCPNCKVTFFDDDTIVMSNYSLYTGWWHFILVKENGKFLPGGMFQRDHMVDGKTFLKDIKESLNIQKKIRE